MNIKIDTSKSLLLRIMVKTNKQNFQRTDKQASYNTKVGLRELTLVNVVSDLEAFTIAYSTALIFT